MKTLNEVLEMEAAVDRLNAKLRETCGLLESLPSEDELKCLYSEAASIGTSLESVAELWNSSRLPTVDVLEDMAEAAVTAADSLERSAS